MRFLKSAWNWISHSSTAWGLLPTSWQAGAATVMSAVAGGFGIWADGIAWGIFIATGVFAFVATGLLRWNEIQDRTNPSGRFRIEVPFYAPELDIAAEPTLLKTIQLGLLCKNTATFPLHYQVEDFDSQIMGRVTTEERRVSPPAEVHPNATTIYRDHPIEVRAPLARPVETGRLRFKIAYWKTPSRKFYIERTIRFQLRHGPEAGQLGFDWNYE